MVRRGQTIHEAFTTIPRPLDYRPVTFCRKRRLARDGNDELGFTRSIFTRSIRWTASWLARCGKGHLALRFVTRWSALVAGRAAGVDGVRPTSRRGSKAVIYRYQFREAWA